MAAAWMLALIADVPPDFPEATTTTGSGSTPTTGSGGAAGSAADSVAGSGGSMVWIIVGVAAIAVVLIAVGLVMRRRSAAT